VPPTLRTIRRHLGALEQACVFVRSPGDWLPMLRNPQHLERRPRYADTFHILESDAAAEWWASEGRRRLEREPGARYSPDRWRLLFGRWREEARAVQHQLPWLDDSEEAQVIKEWLGQTGARAIARSTPAGPGPQDGERERSALVLERAVRAAAGGVIPLAQLHVAGARVEGPVLSQLARAPTRAAGACAMLAIALRRGDRIRNRAGWLVRAFKHGSAVELELARRRVLATRVPRGAHP
jgi:hypothetical protein